MVALSEPIQWLGSHNAAAAAATRGPGLAARAVSVCRVFIFKDTGSSPTSQWG